MGQMSAVTGRKLRPQYVDMINAQTPYLYDKYRLKDDMAFRDEEFALSKERFASDTQFTAEQLEEQKKQAKRANLLGIGNLGITYGMMSEKNDALSNIYGGGDTAKDTVSAAVKTGAPKVDPSFFSDSGAGTLGNWTDAATTWQPYAAGLTGATVGASLGDEYLPFGGEKERKTIGGVLTGGGLGYALSGGSLYSAAIGAVVGGFGGRWL